MTPRSRNSDSVQIWLEVRKPLLREHHPADAEVAELVLVAQVDHVGAGPARPRVRSSCSTLKVYSNAAPSQVHVPWPTPMTRVCRSPGPQLRRSTPSSACAACSACPGVHTDRELPVRSEPRGGGEVQLRPGGVDQVVVASAARCSPGRAGERWRRCPRPAGRVARRPRAGSRPPWPGGTRCPGAGRPAPAGTSPPPATSGRPRPRCSTGSSSSASSATRPPPRGPCPAAAADAGQRCAPKSRPRGSLHAP